MQDYLKFCGIVESGITLVSWAARAQSAAHVSAQCRDIQTCALIDPPSLDSIPASASTS